VRSATKYRSSSSTDQWHLARPDRSSLEKAQHGGPGIGEQFSKGQTSVQPGLNGGDNAPLFR
jgi:hypothetical protein